MGKTDAKDVHPPIPSFPIIRSRRRGALSGLLDEAEHVRLAGRAPLLPAGGRVPHVLRKEIARQNAQERGMKECAKPRLCVSRNQRITFPLL